MPDGEALAEIRAALEMVGGNALRAAHVLGISRRQLYRYLHRLDGGWRAADEERERAAREFAAARARLRGRPDEVHSLPWTR